MSRLGLRNHKLMSDNPVFIKKKGIQFKIQFALSPESSRHNTNSLSIHHRLTIRRIYYTIKGRHRYKLNASKYILNINHTFTVRKWCSVKLLRNVRPVICYINIMQRYASSSFFCCGFIPLLLKGQYFVTCIGIPFPYPIYYDINTSYFIYVDKVSAKVISPISCNYVHN